jgi:NAD-dependent dihydropyrimidine dehydrogenase PreA subunit
MTGIGEIADAAEQIGLAYRGGFRLADEERVGALAEARTLLLFGFVGAAQWTAFAASPEAKDDQRQSLDRWSRRVLTALATQFAATPLFPFEGPPYWPFQAWARRAEPVFPSPLGLLIHPEYGLSHSYRGALAFASAIETPVLAPTASPCDRCEAKPCLEACPVGAFSATRYDLDACVGWLRGGEGGACLGGGCLARRACPVGRDHAQTPEQARFHMAAFLAAR